MKKIVLFIALTFAYGALAGETKLRDCYSVNGTKITLNEEYSGSIEATRNLVLTLKNRTSKYTQLSESSSDEGFTYEASGSISSPDIKVTFNYFNTAILETRKIRWVTEVLYCK